MAGEFLGEYFASDDNSVKPANAVSRGTNNVNVANNMTITQQPGEDMEGLAQRVHALSMRDVEAMFDDGHLAGP